MIIRDNDTTILLDDLYDIEAVKIIVYNNCTKVIDGLISKSKEKAFDSLDSVTWIGVNDLALYIAGKWALYIIGRLFGGYVEDITEMVKAYAKDARNNQNDKHIILENIDITINR